MPDLRAERREPSRLLFLGSLDWRPNIDGLQQFLDDVFPAVRRAIPQATLAVVGRNPSDALRPRLVATAGVELYANVPDVRPYLATCGMLVVPLRIGGGSRLKILEALAAGVPVVSTRIGAEGLHPVPSASPMQQDAGVEPFALTPNEVSLEVGSAVVYEWCARAYYWWRGWI